MIGHNDTPNRPPPMVERVEPHSGIPAPDATEAVFVTVKVPLGELEKQAEYDLGWEDCARHYEKEVTRLREVLQRIANGDPPGEYVSFQWSLDEAMARAAQDALSNAPHEGRAAGFSAERPFDAVVGRHRE